MAPFKCCKYFTFKSSHGHYSPAWLCSPFPPHLNRPSPPTPPSPPHRRRMSSHSYPPSTSNDPFTLSTYFPPIPLSGSPTPPPFSVHLDTMPNELWCVCVCGWKWIWFITLCVLLWFCLHKLGTKNVAKCLCAC